jgi:hypothetical protein
MYLQEKDHSFSPLPGDIVNLEIAIFNTALYYRKKLVMPVRSFNLSHLE